MTTLFYDTATTGLWKWKTEPDDPSQPHLIWLAWTTSDDPEMAISFLIQPQAGWSIEPDAARIHGINIFDCERIGSPLRSVLGEFDRAARVADEIVSYNSDFHKRILRRAAVEAGLDEETVKSWEAPLLCAMRKATPLVKKPRMAPGGGYVFPKFGDAYHHFAGEPMPDTENPVERGRQMVIALARIWRGIEESGE